jgi:HNH endonuclease
MKPIPGYPGYFASYDGRIFSNKSGTLREKVLNKSRYLRASLCVNGTPKKAYVHRLVCLAFHGEPSSFLVFACHSDGNKWNNHAENLRWDSPWMNAADRMAHGTDYWCSEEHREASRKRAVDSRALSDEDVRLIRQRRLKGWTFRQIADEFGISPGYAANIVAGRNCSRVPSECADRQSQANERTLVEAPF